MSEARSFVPAAGRDWLLPLYDPLLRLLGEERIKGALFEAAEICPGQRVLDLGCGTGTLALLIRARCPEAQVVGLDPDPKALAIARRKAERAGVEIDWQQGFADDLPFEDASFDRVVSSLVFHHLPPDRVRATVPELQRVLKPGGSVWVLDFGAGGHHGLHGILAHLTSHQHGDEDVAEELPTLLGEAGLVDAEARPAGRTFMGSLVLTHAHAPG
jgi:ubiquinone/menaquinone biosynthesis C-methylase UbiE